MDKIKKYIPFVLVILFVGWFINKFFILKQVPRSYPQTIDWSKNDEEFSEIEQDVIDSENIEEHSHAHKHGSSESEQKLKELTDEEAVEILAKVEKLEKEWLDRVKLIVGEKHYSQYLQMRDRNEKEKLQAYNQYHEFLRKKHGDRYSYNISEDQSKKEKEINDEYLRELRALIGESKFREFIKAKDELNKEYQKNNELFMDIEF